MTIWQLPKIRQKKCDIDFDEPIKASEKDSRNIRFQNKIFEYPRDGILFWLFQENVCNIRRNKPESRN